MSETKPREAAAGAPTILPDEGGTYEYVPAEGKVKASLTELDVDETGEPITSESDAASPVEADPATSAANHAAFKAELAAETAADNVADNAAANAADRARSVASKPPSSKKV